MSETSTHFFLAISMLSPGAVLTSGLLCQSDIIELFEHEEIDQAAITAVFKENEENNSNLEDVYSSTSSMNGSSIFSAKNEITRKLKKIVVACQKRRRNID